MQRLFHYAKRVMPRISPTERIALESGTSGLERFAFAGSLSARHLEAYTPRAPTANDELMRSKARALLGTVNEHDTLSRRMTPADHPFWGHAKREGFFGLIVPERYGGTPLSSGGLSRLLQTLASASASAPVHVMVPASLGPAELLVHYGTDAQRDYFLPRLAAGAIPCFGLTSLHAGSDAAGSMVDIGTTVRRADGSIGIRIACEKRYITLSPVADVVGIAFKLSDPDGALAAACGRAVDGEITLALVERGTPGLQLGAYTDPLGVGFANGTVVADDVEIGVDAVIGGLDGVGEGWKFLMEALAAGRGVALPAGAAGSSKMLSNAVAAYTCVRRQFKLPLHAFEGVQEKLGDMGAKTFEIDSLVALMNCALDEGERPPILSAILKHRTTELGRDVVMHAMDIVAGSAICMGQQNFVAPAYLSSPIGITVEGSNTMTRSLLIFGQGIVRSHPHLLPLVRAIEADDRGEFARLTRRMVYENLRLLCRPAFLDEDLGMRYARFFSLSANASLLLGKELKRNEFLSGRYADVLTALVAIRAIEWHASRESMRKAAVVRVALDANLLRMHEACADIIANHPHAALHRALFWKTVGSVSPSRPRDADISSACKEMIDPRGALRPLFARDIAADVHPNVARLEKWLHTADEAERARLHDEILRVDLFREGADGRLEQ